MDIELEGIPRWPFTNRGLQQAMSVGIASSTRYISLHLTNDTELSGHGYARASISTAQMTVSSAGVITGPSNHEIYTANDGSAQQAQQVALYDAASGGNQLLSPEAITSPPAAPVNGQAFRLTLTLNP